ncbi:hypothetical protein JOD54_002164 [Actinokineospora baliensis]|uniref:hypothetical protein n=1 Tax=Actinokineospora baliensis TaxID=547056 RepID=UPI001956ED28|nr:hypothetical protein [Actinokineospora baliensis]MBM7771960.1 hypothetical protein [Actinokineospora baliensis]
MKIAWPYSPAQYERVVNAWQGIMASPSVRVAADCGYRNAAGPVPDTTLYELVMSDGAATDDVEAHTLTLFSWSDYSGDCCDVVNARVLAEEFPGWVCLSENGTHGDGSAWIQVGEAWPDSEDTEDAVQRLELLARIVESTTDNPLLSDDAHSEHMTRLANENWDQYLGSDLSIEVSKLIHEVDVQVPLVAMYYGHPVVDHNDYADWLWDTFEDRFRVAYYEYPDNEWYCEGATNVVNAAHEKAMKYAARTVFGWIV